jgi:peptide alpha-N-acetyltransferase
MSEITYEYYKDESQILRIKNLMDIDLSEPYTVFTYRYFINTWPQHCILAYKDGEMVGAIVSKTELHGHEGFQRMRGYIAMLAVDRTIRKAGIGSTLVKKAIEEMKKEECDDIILETETHNSGALGLYEKLGFVRDKALPKYYLSGGDAYRLKLWLK